MLVSAEVRWFFAGPLPEAARTWLRPASHVIAEEPRTDTYLVLPGCPAVGLKLREGRFEIKGQRHAPQDVHYPNDVQGWSDAWTKWSLDDPIVAQLGNAISATASGYMVQVEKRRSMVRYSVAGDGTAQAVAQGERPAEGCLVELTELTLEKGRWWTLGFEAFGSAQHVARNLAATAHSVFSEPPPCRLTLDDSLAYPAWLDSVMGRQED